MYDKKTKNYDACVDRINDLALALNCLKEGSSFKVAQQGYARLRSARQCHKSKVNIRVLFGIFQIKATET